MIVFLYFAGVSLSGALGYLIGQRGANKAIKFARDRADTLEAERDSLQTRYMALLNKGAGK